jgi:hypothetical protein
MVLSKIAVSGTDTGEYNKMSIRETIQVASPSFDFLGTWLVPDWERF